MDINALMNMAKTFRERMQEAQATVKFALRVTRWWHGQRELDVLFVVKVDIDPKLIVTTSCLRIRCRSIQPSGWEIAEFKLR